MESRGSTACAILYFFHVPSVPGLRQLLLPPRRLPAAPFGGTACAIFVFLSTLHLSIPGLDQLRPLPHHRSPFLAYANSTPASPRVGNDRIYNLDQHRKMMDPSRDIIPLVYRDG